MRISGFQSGIMFKLLIMWLCFLGMSALIAPSHVNAIPAPTGSIGDFVWHDLNRNGIQDVGELGKDGVTINLFDAANSPIATATTSSAGSFLFSGLMAGNYSMQFILPANFVFSPSFQGGDPTRDSNVAPGSGFTNLIALSLGENNLTIDAGMYTSNVVAPLPGTILLLGSGLFSIMVLARRLKT